MCIRDRFVTIRDATIRTEEQAEAYDSDFYRVAETKWLVGFTVHRVQGISTSVVSEYYDC